MQGLAYGMLIALARSTTSSDTASNEDVDSGEEASVVMTAVTGAIYLLVVSTSHDLRAGFALLVGGGRAGHRAFGAVLLLVYGIMVSSALTVLASTSNDSASILLNAVAVLFIADLVSAAITPAPTHYILSPKILFHVNPNTAYPSYPQACGSSVPSYQHRAYGETSHETLVGDTYLYQIQTLC